MNKTSDIYTKIIKLTRKINQKHPDQLGLMRIYIFDDGSGGFRGIEGDPYFDYRFNGRVELKKLFKKFGV